MKQLSSPFNSLVSTLTCLVLTALLTTTAHAADTSPSLLVYGAASLSNVLDELGTAYSSESHQAVKFSFAASSTLARQIEAGAKADVFISADGEWMDYLQARNLINTNTRSNLLGNKLVLIASLESNVQLHIAPDFALAAALGNGRLATGDPDSVPAGKYARSALTSLGVWNAVADKLVRADNVRTALAFVDRGEAPLGIVYETDALIDKKVRIVDFFPATSHPPIVFPIALTVSAKAGADKFIEFLHSASAQAAFKKYGFSVLQ
jgi:molybdate transport system substrate-binding protein